MHRLAVIMLLFAACGGNESAQLAREPLSVRGWINDVAGAQRGETIETEIARRTQLFLATSVWVENSEYASGGIAENGSFVVLDVPPNNTVLEFNAPGAAAKLILQGVPGNADVFIPDLVLENNGAKVLDPSKILIRIPASVSEPKRTGKTAKVAGYDVPIIETPLHQLTDRRDYPSPPGFRPVATVK